MPIAVSHRRQTATKIEGLTDLRIDELGGTSQVLINSIQFKLSIRQFVNFSVAHPRSLVSMCDKSKSRQGGSSRYGLSVVFSGSARASISQGSNRMSGS